MGVVVPGVTELRGSRATICCGRSVLAGSHFMANAAIHSTTLGLPVSRSGTVVGFSVCTTASLWATGNHTATFEYRINNVADAAHTIAFTVTGNKTYAGYLAWLRNIVPATTFAAGDFLTVYVTKGAGGTSSLTSLVTLDIQYDA